MLKLIFETAHVLPLRAKKSNLIKGCIPFLSDGKLRKKKYHRSVFQAHYGTLFDFKLSFRCLL